MRNRHQWAPGEFRFLDWEGVFFLCGELTKAQLLSSQVISFSRQPHVGKRAISFILIVTRLRL